MSKIVETAIGKVRRQEEMLKRLNEFKISVISRASHPEKANSMFGEGSLAVWDVQGHNKKYIGNDEINALLTPDVIIPAIEDAIKRLEKSTSDIKGVLSVLEKAIEPIISGEK